MTDTNPAAHSGHILLSEQDLRDLGDIVFPGTDSVAAIEGYSAQMLRGILARHLAEAEARLAAVGAALEATRDDIEMSSTALWVEINQAYHRRPEKETVHG